MTTRLPETNLTCISRGQKIGSRPQHQVVAFRFGDRVTYQIERADRIMPASMMRANTPEPLATDICGRLTENTLLAPVQIICLGMVRIEIRISDVPAQVKLSLKQLHQEIERLLKQNWAEITAAMATRC